MAEYDTAHSKFGGCRGVLPGAGRVVRRRAVGRVAIASERANGRVLDERQKPLLGGRTPGRLAPNLW